jgi:hypothetical protein
LKVFFDKIKSEHGDIVYYSEVWTVQQYIDLQNGITIISFTDFNNDTCHFPNCQKVFKKYDMKSGHYAGYVEQLQKLVTDRSVDFHQDKALFRTFAVPFRASHEDMEPTLQQKLINLHYSVDIRSNSK